MLILFVKENKKIIAVDSETNTVITVKMTKAEKEKRGMEENKKDMLEKIQGKNEKIGWERDIREKKLKKDLGKRKNPEYLFNIAIFLV